MQTKFLLLPVLALLLMMSAQKKSFAQVSYCDSMYVDSGYADHSTFTIHLRIHNNSHHWFAYPKLYGTLFPNTYMVLSTLPAISTVLDAVDGVNNGETWFTLDCPTMVPENMVPENTPFGGSYILQDPNDSSFNCTYIFTFVYGSQPLGVPSAGEGSGGWKIFPVPADENIFIQSPGNFSRTASVTISNALGEQVMLLEKQFSNNPLLIDVSKFPPGIYFVSVSANNTRQVQLFVKR